MRSKKEIVLNNIENIKQWLSEGMTMLSIANSLGVSKQTLYKYINLDDVDTIKNSRAPAVKELENTMFRAASGYYRTVTKCQKCKFCNYNREGKKEKEWEEMVEYEEIIYYPPDTTAGIFLLKNWGGYMNEPRAMEIRKKELELKEKQNEQNNW